MSLMTPEKSIKTSFRFRCNVFLGLVQAVLYTEFSGLCTFKIPSLGEKFTNMFRVIGCFCFK